ncbi:MAG: DUF6259 domain-containing protein [Planctomycetaceae bacterium]|jgi:hypothetical protein|nr:DUF6259 domain-containing protein [Planctomycetaceae bacterium]
MKRLIILFLIFVSSPMFAQNNDSLPITVPNIYRLEDDQLCLEVDGLGRLIHLENKLSGKGNIILQPTNEAFKMVCKKDENWETVIVPKQQTYKITKIENTIRIVIDHIKINNTPTDLALTMNITLKDGTLHFGAEFDNQENDLTVVEFCYPRISVIKSLGNGKKFDLLLPLQMGRRIPNFADYKGSFVNTYPGPLSMQWMALTDDEETLYVSGRDSEFYTTTLSAGAGNGAGLTITRFLFVKPEEKRVTPETILQLYSGSWHRAAQEYRTWASSWRTNRTKPDWVRDMVGYFLVINKQQYGDEMWAYETLPKLYDLAKNHGFDTLGLFGWYQGGHDNTYPDIQVGQTLGGAEKLRENIKKVQQNGGHVTLYVQGHLIDVTSDFYKRYGSQVEGKSHWGSPYFEHYNKSSQSEFLRLFTNKVFSTACPSSSFWQDRMVQNVDFVAGFGADGMLVDQIGGMPPKPCFNNEHQHPKDCPGLSYVSGRIALLNKMWNRTREVDGVRGKDFAFLTENITDIYSQFADLLHGIDTTPGTTAFPEMFRYCFPETMITIRNPSPFISETFVNYAITYGLVMEMEIRYRNDCEYILQDRSASQREYAAKIGMLRRQYRNVLGHARFVDEESLDNGNRNIKCKAFESETQSEKRIAVVLWNPTDKPQTPKLTVKGYKPIEIATVDGKFVTPELPTTIAPQHIVLAIYAKDQ